MFWGTRYPMISKTGSGRVGYRKKFRVAGRVQVATGHWGSNLIWDGGAPALFSVMMTQTLPNLVVVFLESWKNSSPSILTAADLYGQPMRPKHVMKWDRYIVQSHKIKINLNCNYFSWLEHDLNPLIFSSFPSNICIKPLPDGKLCQTVFDQL